MAPLLRSAQQPRRACGNLSSVLNPFPLRNTQPLMARTRSNGGRQAGDALYPPSFKGRSRAPHVLAVRHAVDMLRCLASDTPLLGVTEIASIVGMHKSSVSRMVATLEDEDLVERDPTSKRIRLGPGLLSLVAPRSLNERLSRAFAWRWVSSDRQIAPGLEMPASRAAPSWSSTGTRPPVS